MPGLTAQYGISNTSFGIVIGIGSLIYGFYASPTALSSTIQRTHHHGHRLFLCALSNFAFGWGVNISVLITGVSEGPDLINMLILVMGITIVLNQAFQGVDIHRARVCCLAGYIHRNSPQRCRYGTPPTHRCRSCSNRLRLTSWALWVPTSATTLKIINRVAANPKLDPSTAEGMNQILQYARHWDAWQWCF